jgi:hypothetical protein
MKSLEIIFTCAGTRSSPPKKMSEHHVEEPSASGDEADRAEIEKELTPEEASCAREKRRLMRQLILDKIGDTSILDEDDVHETRSRTAKKKLETAAGAAATTAEKMIVENTGEQNTPVVNVVNKVVIEHVKAAPNANPSGANGSSENSSLNPSGSNFAVLASCTVNPKLLMGLTAQLMH